MAQHELPDLSISDEKLCFIIEKAREIDVKDVVTDPDNTSNPTDDGNLAVLEDHKDDPVVQELVAVIRSMSEDEQIDLVALTWLGRGDGTTSTTRTNLRAEAARAHNRRTAAYSARNTAAGRFSRRSDAQFGISCEEES